LRDCLESEKGQDLMDHHFHNILDSDAVDVGGDETGSKVTFFDTDFNDELDFNRPATKEFTNLRYFRVKHSNPKRQEEMRADPFTQISK
jgi:hypothetical protein